MHASRSILTILVASLLAGCDGSSPAAPGDAVSIVVSGSLTGLYQGDVGLLTAVAVNAAGDTLGDVPVALESLDPDRLELGEGGVFTALAPGSARVRASGGEASVIVSVTIERLHVLRVTIATGDISLGIGDVSVLGVRVQGEGDRNVMGRLVTLGVDDPAVAIIDPSGRVRGVGAGTTTIRATSEGVEGTARVSVTDADVITDLRRFNEEALPVVIDSSWVMWDDVAELHLVRVEAGTFRLHGAPTRRFELGVSIMEYAVVTVDGVRTLLPRVAQPLYDRGIVTYDARGDLVLQSEIYASPPSAAAPVNGGIGLSYRVPGDDMVLRLWLERRPTPVTHPSA